MRRAVPDVKCPRCGDAFPPGEAALSRADNRTPVCAACGHDEAILAAGGTPARREDWPVRPSQAAVAIASAGRVARSYRAVFGPEGGS